MKITVANFEIDLDEKKYIDLNTGKKGPIGTIFNLSRYVFLSIGIIISIKKPCRIMKFNHDKRGRKNSKGYLVCRLTPDNGERMSSGNCRVNRLMWTAFYGEIPVDVITGVSMEIDHIDGIPENNDINNLRPIPHKVNMAEHARLKAYENVQKYKIPIPTNKAKPKQYHQAGLF